MRLHRWAEKAFSTKCSDDDAVATPPDEDVHGWDLFVEFPPKPHDGPADSRPPRQSAFVQVKSTRGGPLRCSIKLSNMLEASRSTMPWFIVLVAADKQGRNQRFYGKHVWQDLMYQSLKAVRISDLAGAQLNRRRMAVSFSEENLLPGDVVAWMRAAIEDVGPNYAEQKAELADNLGHEDGWGQINLKLELQHEDEFVSELPPISTGHSA